MENDFYPKSKLEEVEEFFAKFPEDVKFEAEHEQLAKLSPMLSAEKLVQKQMGKTEFEQDAEKTYKKFVKDSRAWVRQNRDMILVVSGMEGEGKSYFVIMKLARDLDPHFVMERNVLLRPTPETLEERLFEINQYGCLVVDEAMDVVYKRQSASSSNININKLFARVRKFNRIVILILPNFDDLDLFFRGRRVRARIEIIARGLGCLFISKHVIGNKDPWFSDYNRYVVEEAWKDMDLMKATPYEKLALYSQYRTYVGPITWEESKNPHDIALWKRYEELSKKSNLEAIKSEFLASKNKKEEQFKSLFVELCKRHMQTAKLSAEELFALFPKMIGEPPPFSIRTFKALLSTHENWKDLKKKSKVAEHDVSAKIEESGELI